MKKLLLIVLSLLLLLCFTAAFADGIDDEDDDMLSIEELIAWKQSQLPGSITLEDMYNVRTGNLIEEYYGIEFVDAKDVGMKTFMTCDRTMFIVGQPSTLISHTTGGAGGYTYMWIPYRRSVNISSPNYDSYGVYGYNRNFSITPSAEYRYAIQMIVTDSEGNYISCYGIYDAVNADSLSDPTTLGGKVLSLIASETNDSMTDREKALACHEWLTHNAKYDLTYTNYDPDGVLLMGSGVCESYARAYQLLMSELGIPCLFVTSEKMEHAWNMIYVDGGWYHVDVTWDDPTDPNDPNLDVAITGYERTKYFCATDEQMSDHTWNGYDEIGQIVPATGPGPLYPDIGEEVIEPDITISEGSNNVTIDGTTVLRAGFTAAKTGCYTFLTTGELDTYVSVYSSDGELISADDDNGDGFNFRVMLKLEAGQRIILELHAVREEYSGEVPLIVSCFQSVTAPTGTIATLNGGTVSTAANGTPRLIFFNSNTCGNCSAMLKMLQSYDLSAVGTVIAEGCGATQQQAKDCVAGLDIYGAVMGCDADSLMWSMLRAAGFSDSSVSTPVVFYIDAENNIVNYTTGFDNSIITHINEFLGVKLKRVNTTVKTLILPAELNELDSEALAGTSAEIIVIPSGVTSVDGDAFSGCNRLRMIINHSGLLISAPAGVIVTDIPA